MYAPEGVAAFLAEVYPYLRHRKRLKEQPWAPLWQGLVSWAAERGFVIRVSRRQHGPYNCQYRMSLSRRRSTRRWSLLP